MRRVVGRRIVAVEGNTRIEKERLVGERIVALRSWGKHFLVELPTFALRIHFLMFGSYRIDARKEAERVAQADADVALKRDQKIARDAKYAARKARQK